MNIRRNRVILAMTGAVMNLVVAFFLVLMAIQHPDWNPVGMKAEVRINYYLQTLQVLCREVLPVVAGAMVFSSMMFWKLRRDN